MASLLHHPHREDDFYSGVASTPTNQPQSSVFLAPPPPSATYDLPSSQLTETRRNFMNLSRSRGNIFAGSRVEAGPWIPVVRQSTQVGSSATPSCSETESCLAPATHGSESLPTIIIGRVSDTFSSPCLGRNENTDATEIAGRSTPRVSKAKTKPIQIQLATEMETADDRKRKEREETTEEIERRREKINEKLKVLQELIPRCNKTDKAAMLDDAIQYVKSLQMQLQMMSMGSGMTPMMYTPNMQRSMPHMAMGMMGMNQQPPPIPFPATLFPSRAHMAYTAPQYSFPNIQTLDQSRVHLQSHPSDPLSNQPQFPCYPYPYSQCVGLHQMQQPPPPLQNQTTSQLSLRKESSSKEPDDRDNQPTC